MNYLYVFIGGGAGAALRFLLSTVIYNSFHKVFPLGTFIVNITGCLIIGFAYSFFEKYPMFLEMRLFISVGLLGGFTTFSSFGLETFNLIRQSQIYYAVLNVLLSNAVGILFVVVGYFLAKLVFRH